MKITKKDLIEIIKEYLSEDKDKKVDKDTDVDKTTTSSILSDSNISYLTQGNSIEHTASGVKYTVDTNDKENKIVSVFRPNPDNPDENDMIEIEYEKLHKQYELV